MESLGAGKLEERKRQFMTGVDIEDQKMRREQFAVDLRKQKRLENSTKRRFLSTSGCPSQLSDGPENLSLESVPDLLRSYFPQLSDQSLSALEHASVLKTALQSTQPQEVILDLVTVFRKTLSRDMNPPVLALTRIGLVSALMPYMNPSLYPKSIVFESTWALCNLLSGPHVACEEFISRHGLSALLSLITTSDLDVMEHAMWGIGNLSGDCLEYRDMVVAAGGLKTVDAALRSIQAPLSPTITRVAAWALAAMLRSKQLPDLSSSQSILSLFHHLSASEDLETHKEILWGLSNLSDGDSPYCQLVVDSGLIPFVVRAVGAESTMLLVPAIRTLGNLASNDNEITQVVLDFGGLDKFRSLVSSSEFYIRKEVMWTLSNITAGTLSQLDQFVQHPICKEALLGFEDPVYAVRRETAFIYSNIAKQGTVDQKMRLLGAGIVMKLGTMMLEGEPDLISQALGIIYSLLKAGEIAANRAASSSNPAATQLEASGCLSRIEYLQQSASKDVAEMALMISDEFFGLEQKVAEMDEDLKTSGQFLV